VGQEKTVAQGLGTDSADIKIIKNRKSIIKARIDVRD